MKSHVWKLQDQIGPYGIDARLREGGMATLFIGHRIGAAGFRRHVAIKVVHPHLSRDPQFVRMFVDEALLSARIQHPNVVHVEELGQVDGVYFLVMEYVRGCSLSQLERALAKIERRLSPEMAVFIAAQLADGLHAAHETRGDDGELLGVVHRDVSPSNVLLSSRGHVKLIDFGIAKARGRAQETTSGSLRGKLRYMSPEQAASRPVDRRSDVYSLGIVLWEMLTGRRLFAADTELELLDLVRSPSVLSPSRLATGISAALDEAVLHALRVDPNERPPSALVLRDRLAAAAPRAFAFGARQLEELLQATMADEIASLDKLVEGAAEDGETRSNPEASAAVLATLTAPSEAAPGGRGGVDVDHDHEQRSSAGIAQVEGGARRVGKSRWAVASLVGAVLVVGGVGVAATMGLLPGQRAQPASSERVQTRVDRAPPAAEPVAARRSEIEPAAIAPALVDAGATVVSVPAPRSRARSVRDRRPARARKASARRASQTAQSGSSRFTLIEDPGI